MAATGPDCGCHRRGRLGRCGRDDLIQQQGGSAGQPRRLHLHAAGLPGVWQAAALVPGAGRNGRQRLAHRRRLGDYPGRNTLRHVYNIWPVGLLLRFSFEIETFTPVRRYKTYYTDPDTGQSGFVIYYGNGAYYGNGNRNTGWLVIDQNKDYQITQAGDRTAHVSMERYEFRRYTRNKGGRCRPSAG